MLDDIAIYLTFSPVMAGTLLVLFMVRWLRRQADGDGGQAAQMARPEVVRRLSHFR